MYYCLFLFCFLKERFVFKSLALNVYSHNCNCRFCGSRQIMSIHDETVLVANSYKKYARAKRMKIFIFRKLDYDNKLTHCSYRLGRVRVVLYFAESHKCLFQFLQVRLI